MHVGNGPGGAWACKVRRADNVLAAWTARKAPPAVLRLHQKSSTIVSSVATAPDNDAALLLHSPQHCIDNSYCLLADAAAAMLLASVHVAPLLGTLALARQQKQWVRSGGGYLGTPALVKQQEQWIR